MTTTLNEEIGQEVTEVKDENGKKKHRRLQTYDLGKRKSAVFRRGSVSSQSSEMMAKYISSLTNEQRAELTKKSSDLLTERTVKQLELKLEDATSQRNQLTEIVKNLTKDTEDLKFENEEMKNLVQMKEQDLKNLEKRFYINA